MRHDDIAGVAEECLIRCEQLGIAGGLLPLGRDERLKPAAQALRGKALLSNDRRER